MANQTSPHTLPVYDASAPNLAEAYETDGVVLVRDVLTAAEVSDVRRNVWRYAKWMLDAIPADWVRREPDGTLRGMYYLERVDPYFAELGNREDFRDLVDRTTGRRATFSSMETFHKPARVGSPSLVHQDGVYFAGTPVKLVHLWVALDDATANNGALKYWRGSHRGGVAPHTTVDDDEFFRQVTPEVLAGLPEPALAPLPAGSGSVHHDLILHGSDPNTSDQPRLAFAITYRLE